MIFKQYQLSGGRVNINDFSTDGMVSPFDLQRHLNKKYPNVIIKDVAITLVDQKMVTAQWIEGRDRLWWGFFKGLFFERGQ